ncbi:MAG: di/tricarboxylate transporter [Phycisphaerales bacterium]|jgi:di/tricarboxylate transporter
MPPLSPDWASLFSVLPLGLSPALGFASPQASGPVVTQPWHAWFTGVIVLLMVAVLARGRYGTDIVMMGVLCVLLLAGVMDVDSAVQGFANPAVLTVGLLYIVAAGMKETGAMQMVAARVIGKPKNTRQAQARLILPVAVMSAFVNNTPIVAMFLPVLQGLAKRCRLSASQLYMPLSFASILGGVCTLIGTSTNIVVSRALEQAVDSGAIQVPAGEAAPEIGMFTLSWVGIPIAILGLAYMLIFGRKLLPHDPALADLPPEAPATHTDGYHAALRLSKGSPLAGKTVEDAGLRALQGLFLSRVDRGEQSIVVGPNFRLLEGDVIVFVGALDSIVDLQNIRGLEPVGDGDGSGGAYRPNLSLVEAVVSANSDLLGQSIRKAGIRTQYGAAVVAVRRQGHQLTGKLGDVELRAGDTLLLEAPKGAIERFAASDDFYLATEREGSAALRHERGWVAMAILAALVFAITIGWLSPMVAAMTAAGAMILTRCCTGPQARNGVDWQILVTIGAAFGIGAAMQVSGLAPSIAEKIVGLIDPTGPWGPHALLAAVYLLTLVFTMTMTHNASAILMFPIAIDVAAHAGLNPMPFAVAIAVSASCEFSSPIGYQTNLMVMGPGNYKWLDFTRFGTPLNIMCGVLCVIIAPMVWPFIA